MAKPLLASLALSAALMAATLAPSAAKAAPVLTEAGSCPGCQFINYGGATMSSGADVYLIFYGNWSGNSASTTLPNFFNALAGSDYLNLLTLYTPTGSQAAFSPTVSYKSQVTVGSYLGSKLTSNMTVGKPSQDSQIVDDAIKNGQLADDPNGIYFVLTDPTVRNDGDAGSSAYCGYHGNTDAGHLMALIDFFNVDTMGCGPANDQSNMTLTISHELFETMTDPWVQNAANYAPPLAWYDVNNGEVGDPCNQASFKLPGTQDLAQAVFAPTGGNNTSGYTGVCASGLAIANPARNLPEPATGALVLIALAGTLPLRRSRERRGA